MGAVITWNATLDKDTCDNCADLDGQTFTPQTLPGWPGDGSFGDPVLCEGGPNCRCTLTYSDDEGNVDVGTNTLREASLAGDLSAQMGPVGHIDQWIAGRQAFTDALPDIVQPNEVYSAQARAVMRDTVRVQLAQEMGVHPADVPASMVANRVPAIYKAMKGDLKAVYQLLEKHYPEKSIEWISQMKWGQRDVPIEKISVTGPASDKDAKTIRKMSKKMKKGKKIKPLVLIDPGDKGLLQVADGHHRATAALHANRRVVPAYVGTPQTEDNWRKEVMEMQIVRAKKGVLNGIGDFESSGTGPTSTAVMPGGDLVVDPSADPVRHTAIVKDWGSEGTQALRDWYNEGADGQIDWGSDGDFEDCVDIACVAPHTRVLTVDLEWVSAESLRIGDQVASFDEYGTPSIPGVFPSRGATPRRWRTAHVTSVHRIERPCYDLTFEDGTTVRCSDEHRWLVQGSGMKCDWLTTRQLRCWHVTTRTSGKSGSSVVKPLDVWETDMSREAGYLAGAYDGEGSIYQGARSSRVTFSQKPGAVLDEVVAQLEARKFTVSLTPSTNRVTNASISRRSEMLRLLGSIRPRRLLANFDMNRVGALQAGTAKVRLIDKVFVGTQTVIALGTSTHTFFAEGLASHNSQYVDDPEGYCNLRHQDATGAPPGHAPGESEDKRKSFGIGDGFVPFDLSGPEIEVLYAGLVLLALDSGRVLLLQRSLEEDDEAAGLWEFPGGHIEDGEDALAAAIREWQEEVGTTLPPVKVVGRWLAPNGYMGFLALCQSESDVELRKRDQVNPDDPDGDIFEAVAWFWPSDLMSMPGIRREAREQTPWARIVTRAVQP